MEIMIKGGKGGEDKGRGGEERVSQNLSSTTSQP